MKLTNNNTKATGQTKLNKLTMGELSSIRGGGRAPAPQPPPVPWPPLE